MPVRLWSSLGRHSFGTAARRNEWHCRCAAVVAKQSGKILVAKYVGVATCVGDVASEYFSVFVGFVTSERVKVIGEMPGVGDEAPRFEDGLTVGVGHAHGAAVNVGAV